MSIEQRELAYGGKTLTVCINTETKSAQFRFGTREPRWLHQRVNGETTAIFKLGENVVRENVVLLGVPIRMTFDTANSNLKLWVFAHKDDLQFDKIDPENPRSYRITVMKTYRAGHQKNQGV